LASVFSALVFGLAPALQSGRVSPMELLRGGRGSVGARTQGLRSVLVVGEIALALTLTVAALLLVRTLGALDAVKLGFEPEQVVAVRVTPPAPRYASPEAALALYRRMEETARRTAGVRSAALVNHLPLSGTSMVTRVRGGRAPDADESPLALYRTASADYANTLGIRMVRGRFFSEAEVSAGAPVALVNETLAARRWGEEDPVGGTITIERAAQGRPDFGEEVTVQIAGVIADTRHFGPAQDPVPTVYVPVSFDVWQSIFLVVRATEEPAVVAERLRRALLALDPLLPIAGPGFSARVRPMAAYEAQAVRDRRLNAAVLTSFAAVAFVLATVGVFGVLAHLAVQRRREFGVRMSLGASPSDLVRLVVSGGVRLVALGAALGLLGAVFATRLLRGLLFGVEPGDPRSFAFAAGLFLVAGVVASAIPALRAARVHPATVLRED
jgi:predicted permease